MHLQIKYSSIQRKTVSCVWRSDHQPNKHRLIWHHTSRFSWTYGQRHHIKLWRLYRSNLLVMFSNCKQFHTSFSDCEKKVEPFLTNWTSGFMKLHTQFFAQNYFSSTASQLTVVQKGIFITLLFWIIINWSFSQENGIKLWNISILFYIQCWLLVVLSNQQSIRQGFIQED